MEHDKSKSINLEQIKVLNQLGYSKIRSDRLHSSVVLVMGHAGVGKTTLLSMMLKTKLYLSEDEYSINICSEVAKKSLKIGSTEIKKNCLEKILIHDQPFIDYTGLKIYENYEEEISQLIVLKKILKTYKKIKIMVVIEEKHLLQSGLSQLIQLFRQIQRISSLETLQCGVTLVLNKISLEKSLDQCLQMLIMQSQLMDENQRKFISYLIQYQQIVIILQATLDQKKKYFQFNKNQLFAIIESINFINSPYFIQSLNVQYQISSYLIEWSYQVWDRVTYCCHQFPWISHKLKKYQQNFSSSTVSMMYQIVNQIQKESLSQEQNQENQLIKTIFTNYKMLLFCSNQNENETNILKQQIINVINELQKIMKKHKKEEKRDNKSRNKKNNKINTQLLIEQMQVKLSQIEIKHDEKKKFIQKQFQNEANEIKQMKNQLSILNLTQSPAKKQYLAKNESQSIQNQKSSQTYQTDIYKKI